MRYRVKTYTIDTQHNVITLPIADLTVEDVRLIVNETQNKVICSSMQKANITVSGSVISTKTVFEVPTSVCTLAATDKLTIEIDRGEAPSAGGDATAENQRKMMVNFGMADEMPDMQALTDTEIINTYDGYEDEGEHIEGIADTAYGHRRPVQVTIDEVTHTFYVERTYSDYGYSVLYRNGVAIDTTTTHPQEDDELTTTI